jgi:mortality factor 4-like protein 1
MELQEETFQARRAVKIPMPDNLKSLMVDDWENVTKNLQLVQLPSQKPAGVILDEYLHAQKSVRRLNQAESDILEEVVQGLKEYFNKALGRLLLYRFEREQLFDIHTQLESATSDLAGKQFADIYGGEHLLRLFGKSLHLASHTPTIRIC